MTFPSPSEIFVDGTLRVALDLRVYRLSAIKKTAYRMADRCTALISSTTDSSADVVFTFRSAVDEASAKNIVRLFFQELLDQELREEVAEETGALRTLLMAQAFSRTNLIGSE